MTTTQLTTTTKIPQFNDATKQYQNKLIENVLLKKIRRPRVRISIFTTTQRKNHAAHPKQKQTKVFGRDAVAKDTTAADCAGSAGENFLAVLVRQSFDVCYSSNC